MPAAVADDLIEQGTRSRRSSATPIDPDLLYEGSELAGWSVLELPGHADGHLGFLRDGVLIGGDHLLDGSRRRSASIPRAGPIRSATTSRHSSARSSSRRASSIRATASRSTTPAAVRAS